MKLFKVLGIGLATVASLGAIGGITAAVVNKQSSDVTLNTVSSNENKIDDSLKTKNTSNEELDKESKNEVQSDEVVEEKSEQNETKKAELLATENPPKDMVFSVEEINKKFGCSKKVTTELQSGDSDGSSNGYKFCSVV